MSDEPNGHVSRHYVPREEDAALVAAPFAPEVPDGQALRER